MSFAILENVAKSTRHTTFYLSCGKPNGTPIIFVHGWPELSALWNRQLPVFAGLGFHAIAPDMRGYGRSGVYQRHEDYTMEAIAADMIDLLDAQGVEKAIWVGHDWGAPVVWTIAQHYPDRCHGVAALCVPYFPDGFATEVIVPFVDREIYPEAQFPTGQWDYQMFYKEHFDTASAGFDGDVRALVKLLFRPGDPAGKGQPALTAFVSANGGWFGPGVTTAPDIPRDEAMLSEEEEYRYTAALKRNGFFGPDSWYLNDAANMAYAARVKSQHRLTMPILFIHAAYDFVCETIDSRLAEPMRAHCDNLSEAIILAGHWVAQEKSNEVNAALAKWLAAQFTHLWPTPQT